MKSSNELRTMLRAIDHKSYPSYRSLAGEYRFGTYVLVIDHVQGGSVCIPIRAASGNFLEAVRLSGRIAGSGL